MALETNTLINIYRSYHLVLHACRHEVKFKSLKLYAIISYEPDLNKMVHVSFFEFILHKNSNNTKNTLISVASKLQQQRVH